MKLIATYSQAIKLLKGNVFADFLNTAVQNAHGELVTLIYCLWLFYFQSIIFDFSKNWWISIFDRFSFFSWHAWIFNFERLESHSRMGNSSANNFQLSQPIIWQIFLSQWGERFSFLNLINIPENIRTVKLWARSKQKERPNTCFYGNDCGLKAGGADWYAQNLMC